jgi:hypothetical protein
MVQGQPWTQPILLAAKLIVSLRNVCDEFSNIEGRYHVNVHLLVFVLDEFFVLTSLIYVN